MFRSYLCPHSSLCSIVGLSIVGLSIAGLSIARLSIAGLSIARLSVAGLALTVASAIGCQSSESDAGTAEGATSAESNQVPAPAAGRSSPSAEAAGRTASPTAAEAASASPSAVERDSAGGEEPASSAEVARPAAPAPTAQFAACVESGGSYSDCDTIHVTMTQTSPARCVQLTIDDCGGYGARRGLSAELPGSWRLASGSVGSSSTPCELGVFYPANTLIDDATGSISWNERTSQPSEIELKLTLEASGSTGSATSIDIATSEPLNPIRCED